MQAIELYDSFANIKWIYETCRIVGGSVKAVARKVGLLANKKGKFICLDSPHQPVI